MLCNSKASEPKIMKSFRNSIIRVKQLNRALIKENAPVKVKLNQ